MKMRRWKKISGVILLPIFVTILSMANTKEIAAVAVRNNIPNQEKVEENDNINHGGESEEEAVVAFQGEEANREEETSREDTIVQILSTNPEDAQEPLKEQPTTSETTYTKDVYFDQTTLHGILSNKELFFYIPDYWDTKYVYAEIEYNVSELVQSIASSMTFSVNNVPVRSYGISYEGGSSQTCYLEIPMNLLRKGYNSLSVAAYARLYDEEGCIDDFSNANWLSISENSYIRSGYEIIDSQHKISYYPYPFISTTQESGKGLSIAVSDEATNGEISAAMNLMADLSTETGKNNEIQFCLLSDLAATSPERTVLVANYNNLPEFYQQKVGDKKDLDKRAVITNTDDTNGNPLLLVTSLNDDCLIEASYMLMDEKRVTQEKSDVASVMLKSADVAINSTQVSQMAAGNYKIKDIIGSGLTFVGPFHQEQMIYLPFSEDYFLSDAGKVTLNFRYSENLDFNRSLITVYWGDIPVASKKLEKEKAVGDELTFSMPADIVGTTTGAIRIAFDLEIADLVCTPRQDEMPWAYVSEESTLYLPASTGIVLTFDLKPSPFRTDGKFNDMMLVISDKPTTNELNLYAQIIGMYGDGVAPYGKLYVKRAKEFSEKDADYNIITVGNYKNNALLKMLNDSLYFSYSEDGEKFNSNEQLILSDNYTGQIAILQLLESPFASNKGVLAVTTIDDTMLSNVEKFMRDSKLRFSLSKDCVIIDSDLDTKSFQFIKTVQDMEQPGVIKSLARNSQSLIFTVVATSVMLMLFVAVVIILIRIRMYHKKKED